MERMFTLIGELAAEAVVLVLRTTLAARLRDLGWPR
jgi:hypothetical protein